MISSFESIDWLFVLVFDNLTDNLIIKNFIHPIKYNTIEYSIVDE